MNNWYKTAQQRKPTFVVTFKENKFPNTPEQTKALSLENEQQARDYIRKIFPGSIILSVTQSKKYRVKFAPDFSSKDTYEDVVANSHEEAKEKILKKYPNAIINGNPVDLGVQRETSDYLPDGRHRDQSRGDYLKERHNEGKLVEPWERPPLKRRP